MTAKPSTSLSLQGKVAIVTGASRGIGAGVAVELARRGAKVRPVPLSAISNELMTYHRLHWYIHLPRVINW